MQYKQGVRRLPEPKVEDRLSGRACQGGLIQCLYSQALIDRKDLLRKTLLFR